ncbi:hypothetical protein ACHAW6_008828, partial [Cyclotella cf. meneghiniana]
IDIKSFYLNTLLKRLEYIKLKLNNLPEDVIAYYTLQEKATLEGFVYVEIRKGMYGLPQAGLLVQELLEKRLNEKGFKQSRCTPGLWTHIDKPIQFTLVVNYFGIKYVQKERAQFLVDALKDHYMISVDLEGKTHGFNIRLGLQKKRSTSYHVRVC